MGAQLDGSFEHPQQMLAILFSIMHPYLLKLVFYVFTLIFGDDCFIFNFSKQCRRKLAPTSPRGPKLGMQTDFRVYS